MTTTPPIVYGAIDTTVCGHAGPDGEDTTAAFTTSTADITSPMHAHTVTIGGVTITVTTASHDGVPVIFIDTEHDPVAEPADAHDDATPIRIHLNEQPLFPADA